jgi:hypothetical protein
MKKNISKNQYQKNLKIQKIKRKIYQKKTKKINTQTVGVRVEEKSKNQSQKIPQKIQTIKRKMEEKKTQKSISKKISTSRTLRGK